MKILEITEFSAGHCGVWTRVLSESKELVKRGHEVVVFSSNIEKGTNKTVSCEDTIGKIRIKRFPHKTSVIDRFVTKNVTEFNFKNEFIKVKPNLVVTHLIHPHSFKALSLCNKYNIPCYLVTHAPFNVRRGLILTLVKLGYDILNRTNSKIKKFNKIISVTKWETPYLTKMGVKENKIVYIPNGIPEEFFNQKQTKEKKDVLFLGRVAPVKNLETLVFAAKLLPKVNFSIVGPAEEGYLKKLNNLIKNMNNIKLYPVVNDLKEKIKLIDEYKIFVLPSKREAMPQVLLEAMSRRRIVISSKTDGGKEIISDGKNGFLFEINDYKELASLIEKNIKGNKKIQNNAKIEAKKYKWSVLIKDIENAYGLG